MTFLGQQISRDNDLSVSRPDRVKYAIQKTQGDERPGRDGSFRLHRLYPSSKLAMQVTLYGLDLQRKPGPKTRTAVREYNEREGKPGGQEQDYGSNQQVAVDYRHVTSTRSAKTLPSVASGVASRSMARASRTASVVGLGGTMRPKQPPLRGPRKATTSPCKWSIST